MSTRPCRDRAASPSPRRCATAAVRRGSTITRSAMVSPPSGVAAVDTRCTVSGSVVRAASPPATLDPRPPVRPRRRSGRRSASRRPGRRGAARAPTTSTGPADGSSVSEISTVGRSPRTAAASRRITSRSAPTIGARSVLLTTNRSEKVTPGPPLRGTLSPPATSTTKICTSTRPGGERRGQVVAAGLHQDEVEVGRGRRSGRRWRRGWR